jgi:hypothetical protein
LPYLPIIIEFEIFNPTNSDILMPSLSFSQYYCNNTIDIYYGANNSENLIPIKFVIPFFGSLKEGVYAPPPKIEYIKANSFKKLSINISYDWDYFNPKLIINEGLLDFQARFYGVKMNQGNTYIIDHDDAIISNMISVQINEPIHSDSLVLNKIIHFNKSWILCAPQYLDYYIYTKDIEFLNQVIENNPNSVYSLYAKAAFAHCYGEGGIYYNETKIKPKPSKANKYIIDILKDKRFLLSDDLIRLKEKIDANNTKRK